MAKLDSDINKNVQLAIYKQFDDGYIVRAMSRDDARTVQKWYCGICKISRYDLDVALEAFPPGPGFYMGEMNGQLVSSCVRLPWGDNAYYGSMYYVEESVRGKGYGTRLRDEVAASHVGSKILAVDTYGDKVAVKNQQKYRYKDSGWKTVRYEGPAKKNITAEHGGAIDKAADVPFDDLMAYDNKCFVSQNFPVRREFMKRWIAVPGGKSLVARDAEGKIVGLGCRRPCIQERNHMIGPLYADDAKTAEALFQHLCAGVAGECVTINIWQPNKAAVEMLKRADFQEVFILYRMHVNGDLKEYKEQVYGLTSVDVCGY